MVETSKRLSGWHPACFQGCLAAMLLTLVCVLMNGCATDYDAFTQVPVAPAAAGMDAGMPGYSTNYIQEGDIVSITFQYSTNYNTVQQVGLDGTLNLQIAGQVKAAGKTTLQLQSELAALYKSQVKDDPLTVKVVSAAAAVYVTGAVIHPGRIPMVRPMTAVEAIMEAEGYDPSRAKLSNVEVLRVKNGRQVVYHLNLKRVFDGRSDEVFYLQPFDVVQVPVKVFNY